MTNSTAAAYIYTLCRGYSGFCRPIPRFSQLFRYVSYAYRVNTLGVRRLLDEANMNAMLVPMLLPLLLDVTAPVSSADVSVQMISYRTSRMTQNGPVMCALDVPSETLSSSSLQDCSLSCARDDTCIGFSIKKSLTCDHVMTPVQASTSKVPAPVKCTAPRTK